MRLKIDLSALKVAPWLPEKLRAHVEGEANGHFDYTSTGTGLESGSGKGNISIVNGVLRSLPLVVHLLQKLLIIRKGDIPLQLHLVHSPASVEIAHLPL